MKKQTTDEALIELLAERGVYRKLKAKPDDVRNWRRYLKEGKMDEGKKIEILRKARFTVVQERLWVRD